MGHTRNGAKAEGSFIAFCALSDTNALAKARGLRGLFASAVTERSTEKAKQDRRAMDIMADSVNCYAKYPRCCASKRKF